MSGHIIDVARVLLSRIISPWIALGCAWLAAKFGIIFTEDQVKALVDLFILLSLGSVVKIAIDVKTNPMNMASPKLAGESKDANKTDNA